MLVSAEQEHEGCRREHCFVSYRKLDESASYAAMMTDDSEYPCVVPFE